MHVHADTPLPPEQRGRVRAILAAVTIPLLVATLVGLVALWPRGDTQWGSQPLLAEGSTLEWAEITAITPIGGGELDPYQGADVTGLLSSGPGAGTEVPIVVPGEILVNGLDVGDRVSVVFSPDALAAGASPYVFYDFERGSPLIWLTALYLLVVALVAKWRGLAAVLGLLGSLAITAFFVLPAIMGGANPILVVLVGSSAMMFVAVYLAHGVSIRTTTALLGTFVGIAITVALGYWGVESAELSGAQSEMSLIIATVFPGLSLRDLLLCGLVVASLGALNDVTITQASAVWELHAANPTLSRVRLWSGGMRIGRDHIASTVYTLAFAYVGTAMPLLMLAGITELTLGQFVTASEISEEIVRTLVSSIGLVLAIPVTTALATVLVPAAPERSTVAEAAGIEDASGVDTVSSTTEVTP